jgi:hypothetical protein
MIKRELSKGNIDIDTAVILYNIPPEPDNRANTSKQNAEEDDPGKRKKNLGVSLEEKKYEEQQRK